MPILLVGTMVTANTYYTVRLLQRPVTLGEDAGRRALWYTAWQPLILYPISFYVEDEQREAAEVLQAIATWPMGIAGAGLASAGQDRGAYRNSGIIVAGVADSFLLAHDASRLFEGASVGPGYAVAETVASGLQVAYAARAYAKVERRDRPLVLALSATPIVLMTHGLLSLALGSSSESRHPNETQSRLRLAPMPIAGGAILVAGWAS